MAFAAIPMMGWGLERHENKMDPGAAVWTKTYIAWGQKEKVAKVHPSPGSLEDALDARSGTRVSAQGDVFTEELLSTY